VRPLTEVLEYLGLRRLSPHKHTSDGVSELSVLLARFGYGLCQEYNDLEHT
jgi:hypothetical protein